MNILSLFPLPGISYTHDASACLVSSDGFVCASEEERFLRGQHAIGHFPERAAVAVLKQARILPAEVDRLVVTSMERCQRRGDYSSRVRFAKEQLLIQPTARVLCVPHHLAHSALAVLTSPFDECAFLTVDAGGDGTMGHCGTFSRDRFRILETFDLSPAVFFSFVTGLVGFPMFEEGKAMGLAAYGEIDQRLLNWFMAHFRIKRQHACLETPLKLKWTSSLDLDRVDLDSFSRHKYYRLGVDFLSEEKSDWIKEVPPADIARTGQLFFQELLSESVRNLVKRTRMSTIACSGGAFLNAAANGHLARELRPLELFVPIAPHDAGLSLGAALWARHSLGQPRPARPLNPYMGPSFSPNAVEAALKGFPFIYRRTNDMPDAVAKAITDGKVVGWFVGRAEYGARALGARSVVADPRSPTAKARLNQLLKKRDWFMPFAPAVLEEFGDACFADYQPSPYMNAAFQLKPVVAARVPAAVHVDGTCRAQSVSRASHPEFHRLISRFYEMTGIPMILNTSFNRHGLPMVATPRQALQHLAEGCVDILAIEGFIVEGIHTANEIEVDDESTLASLLNLRRAAEFARLGQVDSARRLIERVGLLVDVTDGGFTYNGLVGWRFVDPVSELDGWWRSLRRKTPSAASDQGSKP